LSKTRIINLPGKSASNKKSLQNASGSANKKKISFEERLRTDPAKSASEMTIKAKAEEDPLHPF
jgi:hypothetical protein